MPINNFLLPGAKVTTAYEVANSCRFNDGDSPHMTKSSSAGVNDKGTLSVWVKRGVLGTDQNIYNPYTSSNTLLHIYFASDNTLKLYVYDGGSTIAHLVTDAEYRDCSAWMHIVLAIDSDQGTAANRMKLYVNGTQVTSFSSSGYPSSGADMQINNSGTTEVIGRYQDGTQKYFDGYMAEFVWIDGTQYAASDFGEFDSDSPRIWKPKDVSGLTFGTNGFYLDFEDSANLGNDANGGTDLTENNLAAADQATDTPTNNFCTMLPITKSTDATFSEGNLNVAYGTNSTRRSAFGTMAVSSGQWYWETTITATSQTSVEINLGISSTYNPELIGNALISTDGYSVSFFPSNGYLYIGNTQDESGLGNAAVNDIFGHALDMDAGTLQFYKNGSALGSANDITTSGSNVGELYPLFTPAVSCSSGDQTFTASYNFGSPSHSISSGNSDADGFGNFEYAVPSGYFALCTKNLAEYG